MSFKCPECQIVLKIPSMLAGKPVRCPSCRRVFPAPPRRASIAAEETFSLKCPACQASLKAHRENAGKAARCPKCRHSFALPADPPEPTQQVPNEPALVPLRCPHCSKRLGAKSEHFGKSTRCPRCRNAFTIPFPPAVPPAPPPSQATPPPADAAVFEIACPSCHAALQAETGDAGRVEPCPACGIPFEVPSP